MKQPRILVSATIGKENYINAVNQSGGIAVTEFSKENLGDFDGLLLCGGNDIHPEYYGEETEGAVDIDIERDKKEFELFRFFYENKKPVFGICRGSQLINIALGGNMYQDITNAKEHTAFVNGVDLVHSIKTKGNNFLSVLYGEEFFVNSHHHQAIKKPGEGIYVAAVSLDGKIVEAFGHESLPVFGVQWHPERMCYEKRREDTVDGAEIFKFFIDICKNN